MSMIRDCSIRVKVTPIDSYYMKFSTSESVIDGKCVRGSVFKPFSVSECYGSFPSSSFSIENYQAVGQIDKLVPLRFNNSDVDGFNAVVEEQLNIELKSSSNENPS